MATKTSEKIIAYIQEHSEASGHELSDIIGITDRAIRKQLSRLVGHNILDKIGRVPKVFYKIAMPNEVPSTYTLDRITREYIERNYLCITPIGETKYGLDGFQYWCEKNSLPFEKTAQEYFKTSSKYDAYKNNGYISGISKLQSTFDTVSLNELLYLDFYSIERFGKTKLGQILLYAKQSQDRKLIQSLIHEIRPKVISLIKKYRIDAVCFIPPTVKRDVQFMKEFEKGLKLNVKILKITKIKSNIIVPQKTLSHLRDRIENARHMIVIEERGTYKNVLIIDDAVGSGASQNETAAKLKQKQIVTGKIIGLAITGSFKGFDVISEV